MRAVALRVGASLRCGWRAAVLVAAIVAVVTGAVLAVAGGARRTATAPDRFTAAVGGDPGGLISQALGRPRVGEVAALPAVAAVDSMTFFGASFAGQDEVNPFVGGGLRPSARLVAGRLADPGHPEEFVANPAFVDLTHAKVGDRFPVEAWSQAQVDRNAFGEPAAGAHFDGVLVGVVDGPDELDDPTPSALFPAALGDRDIGFVQTLMWVRLAPGATRADLRAQLDALPAGGELNLDGLQAVSPTVRNAVGAQAQGLLVIAVVAALAGLATLGQVLSRHARVNELDRRRLQALGASRAHIVGEAVGRALVPAVIGVLAGVGLAVLASPLFPFGFVRRVEPRNGIRVEPVLLVPLVAGLVVCLSAWVAVTAWLALRRHPTEHPSPVVEAVATHVGTAAAAAGLRFAFVRSPREAGSIMGTMVGLTLALVGLVGASAFAVSLGRLVDDGARFGDNYDLVLGNGWLPAGSDLRSALAGDPDIDGLMLLGAGAARVEGNRVVDVLGLDLVQGGLTPHVLAGRVPRGADEVALGRVTAQQLGVGVGDELTLEGGDGPATFRVVGLAVLPALGVNEGVGKGALLTFDGVHLVAPEVTPSVAAIVLRPGAPSTVGERLAELTFTPPGSGSTPSAIRNVARVDRVPVLLAGLLGLLAAVLLGHALLQSVRARRRDHAVLRALGADRRCVGRAVHWQATALVVVPLVVGIPVGLVLGRLVYRAFVDRIGAVPDPTTPVLLVVALAVGVVVLANLIGALPAWRARHVPPATLLRAE